MREPKLEKRRKGWALVTGQRLAPFGYLRNGKLRMKSGDDYIEMSPDDMRRIADEIDGLLLRTFEVADHVSIIEAVTVNQFPPFSA